MKVRTVSAFLLVSLLSVMGCVDGTASGSAAASDADPGIEPVTGIAKASLLAVQGIPEGGQTLYAIAYYPDNIDRNQLKAAPARLCAARGMHLVTSYDRPPEHPDSLPGTRLTFVRCQ